MTWREKYVALTFDVDGYAPWLSGAGEPNLFDLSRGDFVPEAMRRLLELLRRKGVAATFFVPGHTALTYPDVVAAAVRGGHEIAHHGWLHHAPTSRSATEEAEDLRRGSEALSAVTEEPIEGYRAPHFRPTPTTYALLQAHGFRYDSSLMGSDIAPYPVRLDDTWDADGPYGHGTASGIVELPVANHLDDVAQYEYLHAPGMSVTGLHAPSGVVETWLEDCRYLAERAESGVITVTMHPEVTARTHRLLALERFIDSVRSRWRHEVAFASLRDVAHSWMSA